MTTRRRQDATGNRIRRHTRRGSALVEFVIALLPYALLFLGGMVLGDLAIAYQRGWIASRWAAQKPNAQDPARLRTLFFHEHPDAEIALEEALDWDADADPVEHEPVLPYTRADIARGLIRVSHSGNYELDLTGGSLRADTDTNLSMTGRLLRRLGYDVESLHEPRAEGIAWLLGTWGASDSAWIGITIARTDEAAEPLPLETADAEAARLRRMQAGGGRDAPFAIVHHAAAIRLDAWSDPIRGTHLEGTVDRDAFDDIPWVDAPASPPPGHRRDLGDFWRKDHEP